MSSEYHVVRTNDTVAVWVFEAAFWEDNIPEGGNTDGTILVVAPETPGLLKMIFTRRWRTVYDLQDEVSAKIVENGGVVTHSRNKIALKSEQ